MKSTAWAPLGRALRAYQFGKLDACVTVHTDIGVPEVLPAAIFFRDRADLRPIECEALSRCRGRVLDAGGGAGAISLLLQDQGFSVTAIDPLPEAVEVMQARGVLDVRMGDLFNLPPEVRAGAPFDTVLLLMNGAGLAGALPGLAVLFGAVQSILAEDGLLLIDSTDLRSVDADEEGRGDEVDDEDTADESGASDDEGEGQAHEAHEPDSSDVESGYDGELHYQLEFEGERGELFPYLFVDPDTLRTCAEACGWRFELLAQDEKGDFLAGLSRSAGT